MATEITPARRRELAEQLGMSDGHLYQCLTCWQGRQMSPADAVSVEVRTNGEIKRWMVRRRDWHRVWPDLIGAEGAPPVPVEA